MPFDCEPEKLLSYKEFASTDNLGLPVSNNFFCFFIRVPEVEGKNIYRDRPIFKKFQESCPLFCERITKVMTKALKESQSTGEAVRRHHRILYKAYREIYKFLDESDLTYQDLPDEFWEKFGQERQRDPHNIYLFR